MAKDEGSKPPPFQLFQQPSQKVEPLPSEKTNQPSPPFQQPPVFQKTPPPPLPPPPPVKPAPVIEEKPRPIPDQTAIKPAGTFNGLTPRSRKILWIIVGVLAVSVAAYFLITFLLKESDRPAVVPVEKTETASAPKPTVPSPPAKYLKGVIKTEVAGSKVNVHSEASEDAPTIVQVVAGDDLVIFRYGEETTLKNGEKGKWCRVAYRAQIGWVWGKYVKEK